MDDQGATARPPTAVTRAMLQKDGFAHHNAWKGHLKTADAKVCAQNQFHYAQPLDRLQAPGKCTRCYDPTYENWLAVSCCLRLRFAPLICVCGRPDPKDFRWLAVPYARLPNGDALHRMRVP